MIGTVLWEEMAMEMHPQPLWTWSWIGCWARCLGRYVEVGVGAEAVFLAFLAHLLYLCCIACVPSPPPGAHTPTVVCVAGVLPPEESPCAAASGLAPRTERAPGPRTGSEASCCGQQALPHQQGPVLFLRSLHASLSSPTPGLPPLGTAVGVHQARGRRGKGKAATLMAWSPAAHPQS